MVQRKNIYLDYAATTPVDREVFEAMTPYFFEKFGNPSSVHFAGQEALIAVDNARQKVADFFGVSSQEIIFTGSATEANNLAIKGIVKAFKSENFGITPHIITTNIEHESVHEPLKDLEKEGVEVSYIPVERDGIVSVEKIKNAIKENTVLVSAMYVNNEIGMIQPIQEISKLISDSRFKIQDSRKKPSSYPLFHTDATQAINYLDCDINDLGVDLMSFSGHKIYGPKGIGGLYIREGINIKSRISGGGQEYDLRSGTENVPYIVGLAKAFELVKKNQEKDIRNILTLREKLFAGLSKIFPKAEINGSADNRIPSNLNILFPGIDANMLLIALSEKGVAVSMGSACQSRALNPSHVLTAIGLSKKDANSSLRFSLGRYTAEEEIDSALRILKEIK